MYRWQVGNYGEVDDNFFRAVRRFIKYYFRFRMREMARIKFKIDNPLRRRIK